MMEDGLLPEAEALYRDGLLENGSAASQAIGYKEFLPFFAGQISAEEAADQIRLSSRRYAKRQLTWFRRYQNAVWLYPDETEKGLKDAETLAQEAIALMKRTNWLP